MTSAARDTGVDGGPVRVVLADDNMVVRLGLAQILATEPGLDVVGQAANGDEALALVEAHAPHVVLLDVQMPVRGGLDVVGAIAATSRVLMLTQSEDAAHVDAALRGGARGYLVYGSFDAAELAAAVRTVAAGGSVLSGELLQSVLAPAPAAHPGVGTALSARERELMDLVAAGLSNNEIAAQLYLSYKTVKNHLNRIFPKLGVASRGEAIAVWLGNRRPSGTR
jgi:DNA-binding NarL/FixJ family response regulator